MTARVQAEIEQTHTLARQFARATDALIALTRKLAEQMPASNPRRPEPVGDGVQS